MDTQRTAMILTCNDELKTRLITLLDKAGIASTVKADKFEMIINLFNTHIQLIFMDIDPLDEERFQLVQLVRRIRPRLHAFVILNDLSEDSCEDFLAAGADFCLLNVNDDAEISPVLEKIQTVKI